MNVLEVKDLVKTFAGERVLAGVSMRVPEHSVYGFLGKNGAGKTTTMNIILGFLRADSGCVSVMGQKINFGNHSAGRYIGYLPDVPEFYPYMTAREYMELCAEISGLGKKYAQERIDSLLCMVGLRDFKKRIGGYSRGMKQLLGIAQALLGSPAILICDEPTSALDPVGRKEILDILREAGRQTTVIFSTHVLADAERICDHVAILSGGRIVVEGGLEQIRRCHGGGGILLEFADVESMRCIIERAGESFKRAEAEGRRVIIPEGDKAEQLRLMAVMADQGICPVRMEIVEPSLETIFMEAAV